MREKQQPIGICDNCLGPIPREMWYTRRGPRLHCGIDCRNTANSRAGAPLRAVKQREHVLRGEWQNPAKLNPPDPQEQGRRSRLGRLREVAAGTWRNPALSDAARAKLSRSRKHHAALHRAMEKLRHGTMEDLTDAERHAYHEYRRQLRLARRDAVNQSARKRYHERVRNMTPEERETLREKWRAANRKRS